MLSSLGQHLIVNAAAIVAVAALALRDQLKLRLLLLVSIALTLFGQVSDPGPPQWDAMFWTAVTWAINAWVSVQIILDRTNIGLNDEEQKLFAIFSSLTPGEFRLLIRLATWHTAAQSTLLTAEGIVPDQLFYVFDGAMEIVKGNRASTLAPQTFIGEIAFLRGTPASATITVMPGTRYIAWNTVTLEKLFDKQQKLRVAVTRLLSHDMALKVSKAWAS